VDRLDRTHQPWAIPVEFQTEPAAVMPGRLLVYGGLTWQAFKPADLPGDRFFVVPIVVHLTGKADLRREMKWDDEHETTIAPIVVNLEEKKARQELAGMVSGAVPRTLLPWIPLMQEGNEDDIIDLWLAEAAQVTDPERQGELRLVFVFAELAGHLEKWKRKLEGFNMRTSKVVEGWIAEGEARGRAVTLVETIEGRFATVPADLRERLLATQSVDELRKYTLALARANTLEEFRKTTGL
jgi:hypothetical protein